MRGFVVPPNVFVLIVAHAEVESELRAERHLVLHEDRPVRRMAPIVQMLKAGLLIVVVLILPDVVAKLSPDGERLVGGETAAGGELGTPPDPAGEVLVDDGRWRSGVGVVVDVIAVVAVAVVVAAAGDVPSAVEVALVRQVDVALGLDGARPRIVEDGPEGCGRDPFVAGSVQALQPEAAVGRRREQLRRSVAVRMHGHAVVRVRTVEGGEEQLLLPLAPVGRAGEDNAHVIGEVMTVADAPLSGIEAADRAGELGAAQLLRVSRDHVDHGEEGARAVERRARAPDDLETLDQRDVEWELAADERAAEHVVVEAMAVDEQQHARVVVAGPREPAHADVAVVPVVGDVEAADASQHVGEGPESVAADLFRGDDRHRRRRFGDFLRDRRMPRRPGRSSGRPAVRD